MPFNIATLLLALTVCMATMALVLPAVMGPANAPARRAQRSVALLALGWALLLASSRAAPGSWLDRTLSTVSMVGIAGGLAFAAAAFDRWCGRRSNARLAAAIVISVAMPAGYAIGFDDYPFRVGWANGLLTVQLGLVAASLWRAPAVPVGRWRRPLVVALVAQMAATAARGVLGAFFTASYPTFLTPHPVNFAFAVVAHVTTVLALVAILLAHRDELGRSLERLATLDGLTGVLNRRAWLLRAKAEMATSARHGHPLAVLMIDLDHFKEINDTHGHEAGDRALRFVARSLEEAVRAGDVVGRYGGEEFCVLMNHADAGAATAFDARMRAALGEAASRELGFALSYSAGIAMRRSKSDSLEAMLRRADATLYDAKSQGRSRTLDAHGALLQAA